MNEAERQSDGSSAYLVGLASLVPGLGFWFLGRKNQAYAIAGVILGLLVVSAVAPWRSVRGLVFPIAYILWLGQIAWAVRVAKSGKGFVAEAQKKLAAPAARSRVRAQQGKDIEAHYLASEIARTQIVASEQLRLSLIGKGMDAGAMGLLLESAWYCIALSQINLILIELDALMKPVSTRRIPLRDVLVKRYQEGYQGAQLVLWVKNYGEAEFLISPQYQNLTRSFLAALR